ncbi:hypothetical protein HanIR_Chr04g0179081 [Helianthus annuus]|nr:hypothetical protein HanIR_Chr04g0179081 [Helianthus annuus]
MNNTTFWFCIVRKSKSRLYQIEYKGKLRFKSRKLNSRFLIYRTKPQNQTSMIQITI